MLIFDFNRDIKLALTITIFEEKNIYGPDHGQDFGLSLLHYPFVMFCNEISWHDLLIRQASGKFADCAAQFANWLANLPIGKLAWPDWQIGRTIFISRIITSS